MELKEIIETNAKFVKDSGFGLTYDEEYEWVSVNKPDEENHNDEGFLSE